MPSRVIGYGIEAGVTRAANSTGFKDTQKGKASIPPVNTDIEQFTTVEDFDYYIEDISATGYSINGGGYDENGDRLFAAATNNITGILGMPYQWDPTVDLPYRNNENSEDGFGTVGRKYGEKILSTMPILFLTPGEPKFMALGNNESKMDIGRSLLNVLNGMDDFLSNETKYKDGTENRYYSFSANFDEYAKYLNASCRAVLFYLGLQDVEIPIPGTEKKEIGSRFMIQHFMNNDFTKAWGSQATLPFFVDAETSISEDYSNSTTESMLASTANGFSQTARELRFIMGGDDNGTKDLMDAVSGSMELLTDNLGNAVKDLGEAFAGKNMLTRVANEITTIVKGGKIVFPEIWSDSSYSRSYNVNLKFRSPDPDPVSIFLNIYLPILALINMGAPRQLNNSANSYEAPFICRATYKSIFSCDMAMIESISITRGGEDKWNIMGMPTSADVSVTFKDLYGSMFISKGFGMVNNTIQMDYLASLAGIDLNEYEPTRIAQLALSLVDGAWNTAVEGLGFKIKQGAARATGSIARSIIPFYNTRAGALGY